MVYLVVRITLALTIQINFNFTALNTVDRVNYSSSFVIAIEINIVVTIGSTFFKLIAI